MKGIEVIEALRKKFRVTTDRALAARLGNTVAAISNWKRRRVVTPRQIAGLVGSASSASASASQKTAIRPLVEFFRIEKYKTSGGANYAVFDAHSGNGGRHPYLEGLRKELGAHHGVYIFFDSRGEAIYTGKARRQSLWREMNLAFNRKRGAVQKIKRVKHPIRNPTYRTSAEKARQIVEHEVPLHELAAYFSAYEVAGPMIDDVEAMLVRSFANNLLNVKMEKFGHQRKSGKTARKVKRRVRVRAATGGRLKR